MAGRRPSKRRNRRRGDGFVLKLVVPLALVLVVGVVAYFLLRPSPAPLAVPKPPACPVVPDVVVGTFSVPAGPIAGFCQAELVNAAWIIVASQRHGSDPRPMQIGVMVAIGESSLRNLNYGDKAGPDSRGLFQQRSNYGSIDRRMNAYLAASAFYQRMFGVPDWQNLTPTEVAHTVQGNANPDYYTPYFRPATVIVDALLADRVVPPLTVAPPPPPPALRP